MNQWTNCVKSTLHYIVILVWDEIFILETIKFRPLRLNCLVKVERTWVQDLGSSPKSSLRFSTNTIHNYNSQI